MDVVLLVSKEKGLATSKLSLSDYDKKLEKGKSNNLF